MALRWVTKFKKQKCKKLSKEELIKLANEMGLKVSPKILEEDKPVDQEPKHTDDDNSETK